MKRKIIKNGMVVYDNAIKRIDILIEDEKIYQLGNISKELEKDADIIDATGMYVMPGMIEPHVHFDSPFMGGRTDHDLLTGTKACAYGGVTTVISFSNQDVGESLIKNIDKWDKTNEGKAYVDWSLHGIIFDNAQSIGEIPELVKKGVPTYKCFTTYKSSGRYIDDNAMLKILEATKNSKGMLMIHCEHDATCEYLTNKAIEENKKDWIYHAKTRPASAENIAVQRVVDLMKLVPASVYIVHTTTKECMNIVLDARNLGLPLEAETCTHYLVLTEDKYLKDDGYLYICSPPLRKKDDLSSLWTAVKNGPLSVVSSDDAGMPVEIRKKFSEGGFYKVPSGMPGVEPRLTILYSEGVLKNKISIEKMVEVLSINPARIFGLKNKGNVLPGYDADIVIFDPNIEWVMKAENLHMNTAFCPFENLRVRGKAKTVLVRGEYVLNNFELVGSPKLGKRVFRELHYN